MLGGLFASTEEALERSSYSRASYKTYRGMGSLSPWSKVQATAIFAGRTGYKKAGAEGVEGRVPFKGSVVAVNPQLIGGLRSGMGILV